MILGAIAAGGAAVVVLAVVLLAAAVGAFTGMRSDSTPAGGDLDASGIPPMAAAAYRAAAATAPGFDPPCQIPSWILAGVGWVETQHGTYRGASADATGRVAPPIIGIRLDGSGATAAISDTDGGRLDGDASFDRAVGPMQFIPGTWARWGRDGNSDGTADPQNLYDAALAAAAYLCASALPMAAEADWRRGIKAYNRSDAYVADVLEAAYGYRAAGAGGGTVEGAPGGLVPVDGVGLVAASWVPQVRALLAAARADGLVLTGSAWRDPQRQIELRQQHCGTSHYAIYEMPSSQCHPPTARPGTSNHEVGLAIDFNACSSRSTPCYRWLAANAARFGIHNLPSEPWHWSIDGQ